MGSSDLRRSKGLSAGLFPVPAFDPEVADADAVLEDKDDEVLTEDVAPDGGEMIFALLLLLSTTSSEAAFLARLSELSVMSMLTEDAIMSMVSLRTHDRISADNLSISGLFLAR